MVLLEFGARQRQSNDGSFHDPPSRSNPKPESQTRRGPQSRLTTKGGPDGEKHAGRTESASDGHERRVSFVGGKTCYVPQAARGAGSQTAPQHRGRGPGASAQEAQVTPQRSDERNYGPVPGPACSLTHRVRN